MIIEYTVRPVRNAFGKRIVIVFLFGMQNQVDPRCSLFGWFANDMTNSAALKLVWCTFVLIRNGFPSIVMLLAIVPLFGVTQEKIDSQQSQMSFHVIEIDVYSSKTSLLMVNGHSIKKYLHIPYGCFLAFRWSFMWFNESFELSNFGLITIS